MKSFIPFLTVAALLLIAACAQPPEYPIEPQLEFISMTKNSMRQGNGTEDTTLITLGFTDGDGDIGNFKEGESNLVADLFLRDLRFPEAIAEQFTIPFVPELGTNNGISGEITFRLLTTCCIFPDWVTDASAPCQPSLQYPADTLVYEIYIMDRAGHESNSVFTDPIILRCEQL
jgi:hypothetical protein